jgi:membrane-associated protein
MFDWLRDLHSSAGIASMIEAGGIYILIGIIFAETGLLFGFFLPGDSLLITAGVLANPNNPHHLTSLNIFWLNIFLILAAVVGDQLGYFLGHKAGDKIWNRPDSRFYKRKHLVEAHDFYVKYGGIAVVAAKYMPIFRTFVPFVAGVARMPYRRFAYWDIGGVILWITSLLWVGFYLGQTPLANRLDKIIVVVIFVSVLPMIIGFLRRQFKSQNSH